MKITVGLPAKQTFILPNHSASDGWALSGKLSDGTTTTELETSAFSGSGTEWTLSIPSATTTGFSAGNLSLYIIATNGTDPDELAMQQPVTVDALGTISHNLQMVTAINALMLGRTSKAYESLTTDSGESITRIKPEELQDWLRFYEKRLAAEMAAAAGVPRVGTVKMRFC